MAKLRITLGAAAYVAFPDWLATSVHVPTASKVTVPLLIVHVVVVCETIVTVNPEVDVALTKNGDVPKILSGIAEKLIVCGNAVTEKLRVTVGAANQLALPG
jgi:hypothetical protein